MSKRYNIQKLAQEADARIRELMSTLIMGGYLPADTMEQSFWDAVDRLDRIDENALPVFLAFEYKEASAQLGAVAELAGELEGDV